MISYLFKEIEMKRLYEGILSNCNVVIGFLFIAIVTAVFAYGSQHLFSEGETVSAYEFNEMFTELYEDVSELKTRTDTLENKEAPSAGLTVYDQEKAIGTLIYMYTFDRMTLLSDKGYLYCISTQGEYTNQVSIRDIYYENEGDSTVYVGFPDNDRAGSYYPENVLVTAKLDTGLKFYKFAGEQLERLDYDAYYVTGGMNPAGLYRHSGTFNGANNPNTELWKFESVRREDVGLPTSISNPDD